jgi:ABC-type lipoprotein release transport system permease subunit
VVGGGLIFANGKTAPAQVLGVDPEKEAQVTTFQKKIRDGRVFATAETRGEAVAGAGLMKLLRLKVGDEFALISQGADGSVANALFRVVGVIGKEGASDARALYLSLSDAQEYFAVEGRVHEVAVRLKSFHLAEAFTQALNEARPEGAPTEWSPWQTVQADFYQSMEADKRGNRITYGVIVFIVAIGVLNTILMSILERTREFGVLLSLGTRPLRLTAMILIEASFMALLACAGASLLGYPLHAYLAKEGIPMKEPIDLGGVIYDRALGSLAPQVFWEPALWIFFAALLVALWPAFRAGRIRPVDALRST